MILSKLDLGNVLERKTTEVKCSSHPSNEGTHYEHDLSPCFLSVIALMFFHIFYFYFFNFLNFTFLFKFQLVNIQCNISFRCRI